MSLAFLKYLRILLFVLIGVSYFMVLLSLTVLDIFYYGYFIFSGSILVILYFLIEALYYILLRRKRKKAAEIEKEFGKKDYTN